jgi:1,4-alpha-glucan branching enzyme
MRIDGLRMDLFESLLYYDNFEQEILVGEREIVK